MRDISHVRGEPQTVITEYAKAIGFSFPETNKQSYLSTTKGIMNSFYDQHHRDQKIILMNKRKEKKMNNLTAKRVIKRQYNTIIDEEAKIRRILSMETDDSLPSQLSVGLLVRVEQHLDIIIQAQNRIVLLQQIVNPE